MSEPGRASQDPMARAIENALAPGQFVEDRECFSFVGGLEQVAATVAGIVPTEPGRAEWLYEAFIAGCYAKGDEVDDSSASFGMFVAALFCGWVNARQARAADPEDTATRLLAWMDDDPFSFWHGLEKDLAEVLDEAGLAALAGQVRVRLDAADGTQPSRRDYARRRYREILAALYARQQDIGAYVALAEEAGLTARDCLAVVGMLMARAEWEQALSWADRGSEIDAQDRFASFAGHELADVRRELLRKTGRTDEALRSAWAEFGKHPSTYSYDELMKFVPEPDRRAWHQKAIEEAVRAGGRSPATVIGLLVQTGETGHLAALLSSHADDDLQRLSHFVLEPAAQSLDRTHPRCAARLWCAAGLRVVNAGKSKYYPAALKNFARAKQCYHAAGLQADWLRVASEIRDRHSRKSGFMRGFEDLAGQAGPAVAPSFLENARARWIPPP
jgi:hypothetical protein